MIDRRTVTSSTVGGPRLIFEHSRFSLYLYDTDNATTVLQIRCPLGVAITTADVLDAGSVPPPCTAVTVEAADEIKEAEFGSTVAGYQDTVVVEFWRVGEVSVGSKAVTPALVVASMSSLYRRDSEVDELSAIAERSIAEVDSYHLPMTDSCTAAAHSPFPSADISMPQQFHFVAVPDQCGVGRRTSDVLFPIAEDSVSPPSDRLGCLVCVAASQEQGGDIDEVVVEDNSCGGYHVEDTDPCEEGFLWQLETFQSPRPSSISILSPDIGGQQGLMQVSASKIEWRLWNMRGKMSQHPKGSCIVSPAFESFGFSGFVLVFYPNGNSNAKDGFCSFGLQAPYGTHLHYKLYVGSRKRFIDLRQNVTESWGFVDMCKMEDELQQNDDSLLLGAEIIDDIDANESLVVGTDAAAGKVEWHIKNIHAKLLHYRKDVPLYSDEFSSGGLDKMRFKFYLAGKKEADLGWCSLYLEAPKGSELQCRLSVGKRTRCFDRLEKFGEDSIWGFLNICMLREEIEQDQDSVRVKLEVLDTGRCNGRLSQVEDAYLKTLTFEKRTFLLGELERVEKLRSSGDIPTRFRLLNLAISDSAKAIALAKYDAMQADNFSGEGAKLKKWLEGLLAIPFGIYHRPLMSIGEGTEKVRQYLKEAVRALDSAVYGHDEPKQKILQLLCQWIANPDSMSLVLGIQGPPGNGKTTLCRKGIAEALQRPFAQISLGGATDASVLEGHSYTYVGSMWGRIVGLIMEAHCMNPIIFFDELDKLSATPRGEEIAGVLTHLTDQSQNKTFSDRYFEGIPFDLSRALFIFSYNDDSKINPVLKDRLTRIETKGFDHSAKVKIAQEYLLPELLANVGLKKTDVMIGREELDFLCHRLQVPTQDGGVRGIKQALEAVVLRINEIRICQADAASCSNEDVTRKADVPEPQNSEEIADTFQRHEIALLQANGKQGITRVTFPLRLTIKLLEGIVASKPNVIADNRMYI